MEGTMDILHNEKKDPLMNTLERFHIYNLSKGNLQMMMMMMMMMIMMMMMMMMMVMMASEGRNM
jgi:hypothetical protein